MPFTLMANYRQRLLKTLENCRKQVPPERQVESPPEIAGPIFERLRYMADDEQDALRELYLGLLTASIDSERQRLVHPAFVFIVNQLSRDEVTILNSVPSHSRSALFADLNLKTGKTYSFRQVNFFDSRTEERRDGWITLAMPDRVPTYLRHLASLNLVFVDPTGERESSLFPTQQYQVTLTEFGALLLEAAHQREAAKQLEPASTNGRTEGDMTL